MEVTVRQEAGYELALYGFSLSYKDRSIKPTDWWLFPEACEKCPNAGCFHCDYLKEGEAQGQIEERMERTGRTALANCGRGMGHDKWIRQVMLWIDIEAPRYWWSEFDTYKVGTVAQSESTMHSLSRRDMTVDDLQGNKCDEKYSYGLVSVFNKVKQAGAAVPDLKKYVPEAYLQRRLVTLNYEVLRTIIKQRKGHRLPEWKTFIDAVYAQVEHPELLPHD